MVLYNLSVPVPLNILDITGARQQVSPPDPPPPPKEKGNRKEKQYKTHTPHNHKKKEQKHRKWGNIRPFNISPHETPREG